jgi:hypothetical protein
MAPRRNGRPATDLPPRVEPVLIIRVAVPRDRAAVAGSPTLLPRAHSVFSLG